MVLRIVAAALAVTLVTAAGAWGEDADAVQGRARLGTALRLGDVVLPAPEVRARPLATAAPLVVRVLAARPHGASFRYDLEVQGLEPGRHDVRAALETIAGEPLAPETPPVWVRIDDPLAPGLAEPHRAAPEAAPSLGGYRMVLSLLGGAWLLAGVWLVVGGKHKASAAEGVDGAIDPEAARAAALRALVERAIAGTLDTPGKADLERALLGHWRRRKGIAAASPEAALATLRADPETKPLFAALAAWLYQPEGAAPSELKELLEPHRVARAGARAATATEASP